MGILHASTNRMHGTASLASYLGCVEGRMKFCGSRLVLLPLAAGLVWAQTQVDLKSQSKNVDFSGAVAVKPLPVGTTLPGTCSTGAMFFKSDAEPGANLYACVATNTWALESGGGGASDDLRADSSPGIFAIATGNLNFVVNGLPVTFTMGPATITRTAGTDTGTFFAYGDYNAGAPVIRCGYGAGINIGNYTVSSGFSGSACVNAPGFPAESIPLSSVDISAGNFQPPADQRALYSRDTILAGTGLSKSGNVLLVDASVIPNYTGSGKAGKCAQWTDDDTVGSAGDPCGFLAMTVIRESHRFIDSGYTQGLLAWAFSAGCTNPGTVAASAASIYPGVSFGSPDAATLCFAYRSEGGGNTAMVHADVFSGSSPSTLDSRNVYKRTDTNGNHYIGLSGSVSDVDNFIGCWYDASANLWKSLIRSGAAAIDSDSTGVTGSTAAVVVSFGNGGVANSITCSVNGAGATSTGAIPATMWVRVLGALATGAPDAVFEIYESRFQVSGINRSAN